MGRDSPDIGARKPSRASARLGTSARVNGVILPIIGIAMLFAQAPTILVGFVPGLSLRLHQRRPRGVQLPARPSCRMSP